MERIIITHWNKQTGPEPIIQYPPEKPFPAKDIFLKIWAKHELNKENSMITYEEIENGFISIIQQFEGEIWMVILVYLQKDMIEHFLIEVSPDILAIISRNLVELINTNKITRAISEAYNTIKNYSKLDREENLINFFQDKIKFTILQILRNGVISKSKLTNILRHDYGFSTVNIDLILTSFFRESLIVKQNVPGSEECYFLVIDLSCTRIPPNNLTIDQKDITIIKKYQENIKDFYLDYDKIIEVESKTIIQTILLDKDVFTLIRTLRERSLSVNECLNILNNKEGLFNELLNKKFIYETKGLVFIFSDVRFIKFIPYYIIDKLIERYRNQEISLNEYLTHLQLISEQLEIHPYLDYEIV